MGSMTTSISGSVANFQSQTYAPIRSLKARFAPVQFDKIDISINNPKSIYHAAPQFVYVSDDLPIAYDPAKTTTSNGLTWSIDGNGWCSFSGTPTAFSGIDIGRYYIRSGTETVKIKLIGDCSHRIIATNTTNFYNANGGFLGSAESDSALQNGINMAEYLEIYPTASYIKISLKRYYNDVFIQGKVFVTLDIDDKPTYTAIPMTDNLFDVCDSKYYRWISDAGVNGSNSSGLIGNTISVNPDESYTIGYFGTKPYSFSIIELDKDRKFIKRTHKDFTGSDITPLTVTTTDTTHYIIPQISCNPDTLTPQIARSWKIKLVKGDTLTSYGDAYYGGYIDLISGNVVVDWRETTVGECAVTKTSDALDAWTNFYISPWPRCIQNQPTDGLYCACDQIITTPQAGWLLTQSQEKTIIWSSAYDGTFRFKSQEYASLTADELKQLFYDATIIYRVEDPIATYQLTPQQLNTLIGKNYMWSNTGNIEVEYDLTEMCNVQMARHRMLMNAPHTEVANAQTARFTTDMAAKIKDCKVTFAPTQYGSNSSLTNVRGIYGLGGITIRKAAGENIGHITGYSAWNPGAPLASEFSLTNSYGTTLSTTSFTLPDTPLVITQSQWPNTTQISNYQNGYFAVAFDNLTFYKRYNVSFKVTDITNNPLNAQINQILLIVPSGSSYSNPTVSGNKLIFKNVLYIPYSNQNGSTGSNLTRNSFELRNCGMSFTLSEFMVTPVEDDDHSVWEAYQDCDSMTVALPTSKNLFDTTDITSLTRMDKIGRTFTNNDVETRVQIYVNAYAWNTLLGTVATSLTPQIGRNSLTFEIPNNCRRLYIKNNGSNKDFGISFRWNYPPGIYTVSFDLVSDDPTTVGGFIIKDIQIEAGSTATAYEPYSPTYGGTLDLTNGQLTVTHVGFKKKLSEAYSKTDSDNCVAYRFHEDFDGGQVITNNTQISNIAPYQYEGNTGNVPHFYATYGSSSNINIIIVYVPIGTDENTEFQAVLPLSEPLTYQLTPETIRTVKGMNNIWGDTNGNTEVTYWTH